jgi:opacity protein-like surface antigen
MIIKKGTIYIVLMMLFVTFTSIQIAEAKENKTEGHYISLKVMQTNLEGDGKFSSKNEKDINFALGYDYAWNFDSFFLTTGADYTKMDNTIDGDGSYAGKEFSLGDRIAVSAGIGKDFDNFNLYSKVVFGAMHYYEHNATNDNTKYSDWNGGLGFAFGTNIPISEKILIGLEYEMNENEVRKISNNSAGTGTNVFEYQMIKTTLSYRF